MTAAECGNFIAKLRKEKNLTQKQLAEVLNVSDKAISRWETGKGYPDVTSLVALSMYFNVTVNELLAGQKINPQNIVDVSEQNIIDTLKTNERQKKKNNIKTFIWCIAILLILLPAIIPVSKELLVLIVNNFSTANITTAIAMGVVGIFLIISGIAIYNGAITLLHSYHYRKVTDREGYCKEMGKVLMVMSIPFFISTVLELFASIHAIEVISSLIILIGTIVPIFFIIKIQIKYNGGVF